MSELIILSQKVEWSGARGVIWDIEEHLRSSGDERRSKWFSEGDYIAVPGEVWNFAGLKDTKEIEHLAMTVQQVVLGYEQRMKSDTSDWIVSVYRDHALQLIEALRKRLEELGQERG